MNLKNYTCITSNKRLGRDISHTNFKHKSTSLKFCDNNLRIDEADSCQCMAKPPNIVK